MVEKGGGFAVTKSWLIYVFASVLFPWYFNGNQRLTSIDGQMALWITQLKKEQFVFNAITSEMLYWTLPRRRQRYGLHVCCMLILYRDTTVNISP